MSYLNYKSEDNSIYVCKGHSKSFEKLVILDKNENYQELTNKERFAGVKINKFLSNRELDGLKGEEKFKLLLENNNVPFLYIGQGPFGYSNWNIDIHPYPGNIQGGLYLNNWTRVWILESPGGNNWEWNANYSMIRNANGSGQISIKPITTGYMTIKARKENECGCGNWLSKNYYVTTLSNGGHHYERID